MREAYYTGFGMSMLRSLPYKIKLPVVGALFMPLFGGLVLKATGSQLTPQAYLLPFTVGGTFGFLIGLVLDNYLRTLDKLKEANRALHLEVYERARGEAWYAALFEMNHCIILLLDPETGRIVDGNPTACDFYGYDREKLKSMHIGDINTLPKQEVERELALVKHEKRKHFNFKHRLASGEIREVEVHSGAIHVEGTDLLLSVINDVTELRLLRGIIPICSMCKQIRDDKGYWNQVESYIAKHSEADFSHSICPDCAELLYPDVFGRDQNGGRAPEDHESD